jgi:hypothetical protein
MSPRWIPLLLLLTGITPAMAAKFPDNLNVTRNKNIFDSSRQPVSSSSRYRPPSTTATVRQETLRLCGIWEADKAIVALTENNAGTTAQLQIGGAIGTWKIESISMKEVLLVDGVMRLHWRPGNSLVHPEGEKWTLSDAETAPAFSPSATTPSTSDPGKGTEPASSSASTGSSAEDILKRLRERREKETKK